MTPRLRIVSPTGDVKDVEGLPVTVPSGWSLEFQYVIPGATLRFEHDSQHHVVAYPEARTWKVLFRASDRAVTFTNARLST